MHYLDEIKQSVEQLCEALNRQTRIAGMSEDDMCSALSNLEELPNILDKYKGLKAAETLYFPAEAGLLLKDALNATIRTTMRSNNSITIDIKENVTEVVIKPTEASFLFSFWSTYTEMTIKQENKLTDEG